MIKHFIDVGIAVRNLEAAAATYSEVLGLTISLVASDDPRSPIARFLETRGEGINHLTLEITNLQDIAHLAKQGVEFLTDKPLDFPEGRVIFAHPRSLHGVQIAFVQPKPGVDLLQQPPSALQA